MNGEVMALFMYAPKERVGVRQANILSVQQQPNGTVTSVTSVTSVAIEDIEPPWCSCEVSRPESLAHPPQTSKRTASATFVVDEPRRIRRATGNA